MDENNKQPYSGGKIKTVRTYLSDMADTVRENEVSVIKVALAEQNKNERENIYRQVEGSNTKKTLWFIGGIVFIALAIFGVYYILNLKAQKDIPNQIVNEESIISYDKIVKIENTENLTDKLLAVKKEAGGTNEIKYILLSKDTNGVKEKISTKDLFSLLGFTAPSSLVRSLSDSYMVGTYTTEAPHLFMIFQTKDYSYSYAGMLEWEKTLANDLIPLFESDTKESKIQIGEKKWDDFIINNKDARTFTNESDKIILYYLFNDKNTLIIADNPDTIKEIISKLIIKNIKPL